MISVLKIEYDPDTQFCTLHHTYNKRFVSFVSSGIKPISYRRYDPSSKCWMVHASKLPMLVSAGKRYFDHVDYSSLPEYLQIKIVRIIKEPRVFGGVQSEGISDAVGPHAVLFVLESAPWEVVQAAYKALALKAHPDHGGSSGEFQRIQKAYEELKSVYKP